MSRRIAILTGGTSTERAIALQSADSVRRAIGARAITHIYNVPEMIDEFLRQRQEFDCVIPVFHGRGGEDGTIQGFLEVLGLPYVFSRVEAHALALDKSRTNDLVSHVGLRVPKRVVVTSIAPLRYVQPVVIKPVDGGSSVGVTIAHSQGELNRGLRLALKIAPSVLVEQYIIGDEFSVAVVDIGGATRALPVISIVSQHGFFDYQSKYTPGLAVETCPADIAATLAKRLQQAAVVAHRTIGCLHVSRSDFIVDRRGRVWFLEINTIPGMSVLLPKAIAASGRDFGQVLMGWVEDAIRSERR